MSGNDATFENFFGKYDLWAVFPMDVKVAGLFEGN